MGNKKKGIPAASAAHDRVAIDDPQKQTQPWNQNRGNNQLNLSGEGQANNSPRGGAPLGNYSDNGSNMGTSPNPQNIMNNEMIQNSYYNKNDGIEHQN